MTILTIAGNLLMWYMVTVNNIFVYRLIPGNTSIPAIKNGIPV